MQQLITLVPLVLMFGLMYVILILPQRKKEKKTREMLNALKVGDNVTTIGGVMGRVVNIKDDEITIESGVEKTKVKFKRWGIKEVEKVIES
ncbi:protein translocase subunit yajC [Anaerobacterium chartisolvens]|uniref:Protein translocase subunit yajC n=1 Tax=Anaerobacterium chartisolvens TaxID=1297424 RepID=A0A369AX10_9FIRM|nr:preprotein translocase subunit YajC [Anaerobacterium chartisolvens]RCX13829.1 protein translocase subunit yajC [Anaerobacterium chartisolvens]